MSNKSEGCAVVFWDFGECKGVAPPYEIPKK